MKKVEQINGYKLYKKQPNSISNGALYTKKIHVNVKNKDKTRLVRVYLPSNYDFDNPNKRFAVMYMMDGKNLFDKYTSFVGEWNADEIIEEHVAKDDMGLIIVGIDSAKDDFDRTNEMLPESDHYNMDMVDKNTNGYGSILADYIFSTLKPEIDQTFYTLNDECHTAVGGASMGGLYAFYMGVKYADRISFSLCFSPAFALYDVNNFMSKLSSKIKSNIGYGKFIFFIGGNQLEKMLEPLTRRTYVHLKEVGFNDNQTKFITNYQLEHNEYAWSQYFDEALNFWGVLKK